MPKKPNTNEITTKPALVKDDKYYEALNQRLMVATTTLTGAFILIGLLLYVFLSQ